MKEYTPIRRFYAHVGFVTCLAFIAITAYAFIAPDSLISFLVKVIS